jgi:hypothetical protein
MGRRNPNFDVLDRELYETPVEITVALLRARPDIPAHLWEPAAGHGKLSDVLNKSGRTVVAEDIEPGHEGIGRQNFLRSTKPPNYVEAIITNPPFSLAPNFIDHARDIAPGLPIFYLLPAQFFYVQGNARFWADCRSIGYVTARPKWIEGSKNTAKDNVAWHEFGPGDSPTWAYPCHTGTCEICGAAVPGTKTRYCSDDRRAVAELLA